MAQQDACTLLDDDHNKVARLFQQFKAAHQPNEKRMLAQQICHELTVHTQIEEEIFYPAFQQATGDDHLIQESNREHQEARELIAKIEGNPQPDDRVMLELEDAVLHHVNDEREKMFPKARKAQGLDLFQLADRLEQRKSELMAAHPA
jgi:iron-sulfur cluster repair protein YtfE (RIC family)